MVRKGRKGASRIAGAHTSPVPGLVASIKQHKNFRQLASYSVKCLCKVITPPHVGWEEMMVEAFDCGALEAITAVLKKHSGDEEVLSASTACLTSLATKPQYAGQLVHSGAMLSMVDSVTNNPEAEQGVAETMNLLEVVSTHNPEALVEVGGMKNLTALLKQANKHPDIMGVTARTLEKMNRVAGGGASLVEVEGIPTILAALAVDHGAETEHLGPCFRLLDRLCRNADHAEAVRNANGMKLLCAALNTHKDKVASCKIGSRVLTKLASGNVKELITQMESTDDPSEREFLAQLLANLALEEDNAEKIVKCGGIPSLVNTFTSTSEKTLAAASRALARIAAVPENIMAVVEGGAIQTLVNTINKHKDNADIVSSCTPTLLKLAATEEIVDQIVEQGGLTAVLTTLAEHPEFEEASAEALKFVENLGTIGYNMDELVGMGAIEATVAALKAHPENADVQLQGTRALIYMADSEENLNRITKSDFVPRLTENLTFAADNKQKDLAVASMFLSSSMGLMDENRDTMIQGGCVDTILGAIAAFGKDDDIREAARDVVETVVDEESVKKVVDEVQAKLAELIASPSAAGADTLIKAVGKVGAFSILPSNAEILISTEGVRAVVAALEQVAQAPSKKMGEEKQEAILRACSRALMEVSDSVAHDDDMRTQLGQTGAVKAVITSIKGHPKLTDNVRAGVHFLESYAQIKACAKIILDEGGIQACVTAMRANQTDLQVCSDAVNTMLQLAVADEGAVAVAKQGGTRQVINTVEANINTPNFSKPMEGMLRLLQRVALTAEGAEVLVKQGGVEAVIDAADALSDSARVAQASSRVLAKLLTRDDVTSASARLTDVKTSLEAGGVLPTLADLKPVVSRVGHMALVGHNADVIRGEGGVDSLAFILTKVLAADDEDVKKALLPVAIQALSNIAKGTTVDPSLGVVALLNEGITTGAAVAESVEALQSLAKNPDNAMQMLETGVITRIVDTLKVNLRDTELCRNCFSALADAAQHEAVAAALSTSPAVRLAQDWIDDNMDDADSETMTSALNLLSTLSTSSVSVCEVLVEAGVVDLIKGVLTKCCMDDSNSEVLANTVRLVSGLSTSETAVQQLASQGGLKRVIRAVNSRPEYVASSVVMGATLQMLDKACKPQGVALGGAEPSAGTAAAREVLRSQGADELIVQAMNENGNNSALLEAGATAMATLGCGAEAGASALDQVKEIAASIDAAGGEASEEMTAQLGKAVQRLGNLMMVEGIVSRENAPEMMAVLSDSLAKLVESETAGHESLAAGVQSIGRLAALELLEAEVLTGAVEMVMDVMQLNDDVDAIRESAIHCLGNMAQGSAVISVMAQQGCMAIITEAAKSAPADEQLQAVVAQTLKKITDVAEHSAQELVAAGADGADALASVIEANAQDEHMLASCVEAIVCSEAGTDALWSVLDSQEGSEATQAEMVRVLREKVTVGSDGAAVTRLEGTPQRVTGLLRSMRNARATATEHKSNAESRVAQKAVRTVENTLSLLLDMDLDAASSAAFAESGGVVQLLDMLDSELDDMQPSLRIVSILTSAAGTSVEAAAAICGDKAKLDHVVEGLKIHMESPQYVAQSLKLLKAVVLAKGAADSHLDREAMRTVQVAMETHPASTADATEIINQLSTVFSDEPARIMMARLESAQVVIQTAGQVQSHKTEDGRTYYVDRTTNQTSWEPPAEIVALQATMKAMADMAAKQEEDNVMEVEYDAMQHVVQALANNAADLNIATSAARTLNMLSNNEDNCDTIAETGGVAAIIHAIKTNPSEVELLRILLVLLERISRNDLIKEKVAADGGVDVVISVGIAVHTAQEDVVSQCLSILANLAFNSSVNIELIMSMEGVKSVETALQAHPLSRRLLENAMCTLSNLMFGHDENKLIVGQTCGDEIVDIIRQHYEDPNLFKMALRALGNLCYCDENIRYVVEEGATAVIVTGMDANSKDMEALQLAMEVLGNFASLEEEDEELTEEQESVAAIIFHQGGTTAICKYMRMYYEDNSALVKAGMDALSNVANDIATTEMMAEKDDVVGLLNLVMQGNDWDQDLHEHTVPLFTTLTYSPACANLIAASDGIPVLLSVMQTNTSSEEIMHTGQTAFTNLASNDSARQMIANIDGVSAILTLLQENMDDKDYVQETMATLTRLSSDDELSSTIAELGTHIIMEAVKRFNRDPDFLTHAFRLLGHLAFVESNLKMIVQYDGIQVVMDAIFAHPEHKALMVRSIQTIDNIAMANKEHAAIVIEKRGRELINEIMEAYADDEEIVRYGKSAVLSMSALENLSRSDALAAGAVVGSGAGAGAGAGPKPPGPPPPAGGPPPPPKKVEDPLKNYRNMLSAGSVLNVWTGGKMKPAHVLASPDWRSLVWQDPKRNKKLGAMDLRAISVITEGPGDGHKKGKMSMGRKANPDCCFTIVGDRHSLHLEVMAKPQRKRWVEGVRALVHVFKTNPGSLR